MAWSAVRSAKAETAMATTSGCETRGTSALARLKGRRRSVERRSLGGRKEPKLPIPQQQNPKPRQGTSPAKASGGRLPGGVTVGKTSVFDEIQSVQVVGSLLFCPICSPQMSAEDAGYLYYPADEEIPVRLCKYLYGYPRDFEKRFETLEELGKGSFGVVHRVVDKETGEFYAAKTLPKSRPTWTGGMDGGMREATTSSYLLKIQAEVNFLARLKDVDEIVQLVKAYEDDSHVHLVMDLCTGGSLYEKMQERSEEGDEYFDEETVRRLMGSVIRMLVSCHARGIIYRDLKPQNFLYIDETPDSDIKCSDYGLAMSYIPDCPQGIALNKRAGTPVYMAPEVVLRRYDEKADLWSAGMLMYQLLGNCLPLWNGSIPFTANLDDIFYDTLLRDIDFGHIASRSSEGAADLCAKLLTRDPDKRITAAEASQHPWLLSA